MQGPVLLQVAPGDPSHMWETPQGGDAPFSDTQTQPIIHRTLCPQTASLSIAETISPVSGPRLTKIMCILDPASEMLR